MYNKTEILNKLCKYNEYILSYHTTNNTQNLVNELIKLRDTPNYNDLSNLLNILETLIVELDEHIKNNIYPEYLDCIKDNIIKSRNYVIGYIIYI